MEGTFIGAVLRDPAETEALFDVGSATGRLARRDAEKVAGTISIDVADLPSDHGVAAATRPRLRAEASSAESRAFIAASSRAAPKWRARSCNRPLTERGAPGFRERLSDSSEKSNDFS